MEGEFQRTGSVRILDLQVFGHKAVCSLGHIVAGTVGRHASTAVSSKFGKNTSTEADFKIKSSVGFVSESHLLRNSNFSSAVFRI